METPRAHRPRLLDKRSMCIANSRICMAGIASTRYKRRERGWRTLLHPITRSSIRRLGTPVSDCVTEVQINSRPTQIIMTYLHITHCNVLSQYQVC